MANKPKTYTAPHPVYVDRQYFRAGEPFTTASEKGERWEPVKNDNFALAIDAALDPIPGGVSLEDQDLNSLRAIATESNIPTKGLSKQELVDAIKARSIPEL